MYSRRYGDFLLAMASRVFQIHYDHPGMSEEWYFDHIVGTAVIPQNLSIAREAYTQPVFPSGSNFSCRFTRHAKGQRFWDFDGMGSKPMHELLKWGAEEVAGYPPGRVTFYSLRKAFFQNTFIKCNRRAMAATQMNHTYTSTTGLRSYAGDNGGSDLGGNHRSLSNENLKSVPRLDGPSHGRLPRSQAGATKRRHDGLPQPKQYFGAASASPSLATFANSLASSPEPVQRRRVRNRRNSIASAMPGSSPQVGGRY